VEVEEEIKENVDVLDLTEFDKSVQLVAAKVQEHAKEKLDSKDKDDE